MRGAVSVCLMVLAAAFAGGCNDERKERQRAEEQALRYLEQKVGECDRRGGVARLDPVSGYLGCDFPVRSAALAAPSRAEALGRR
jgi:hypothetical protein